MTELEFDQLVELAVAGDKSALAAILEYKAKDVLYICTHLMGNMQDGEDAAQEVLIKVQTNISKLKSPKTFGVWLNQIITNTCHDMRRKHKGVAHTLPLEEYAELFPERNVDVLPAVSAERREAGEIIMQELSTLPHHYQEVLLLFYYENLSVKEIATVLGITPKKVENRLYTARLALRKRAEKRLDKHYEPGLLLAGAYPLLNQLMVQEAALFADRAAALLPPAAPAIAAAGGGAIAAWLAPLLVSAVTVCAVGITIVSSSSSAAGPPVQQAVVPQQSSFIAPGPAADEESDSVFTYTSESTTGASPFPALAENPTTAIAGNSATTLVENSATAPAPALAASTAAGSHSSTGSPAQDASPGDSNPAAGDSPATSTSPSTGGGGVPSPASPQPTTSASPSESTGRDKPLTTMLRGALVFVDNTGQPVQQAGHYGGGMTIALLEGETTLATATVAQNGTYRLVLPQNSMDKTLRLAADSPFGLCEPAGEYNQAATAFCPADDPRGELPDYYITDTLPPSVAILFYTAQGDESSSALNPFTAAALAEDATATTTTWQITPQGSNTILASGEGQNAGIPAGLYNNGLTWYTITFSVTDHAGNTTQTERSFVLQAVEQQQQAITDIE